MAGYENSHRLRAHQIGIELDIGLEDGRNLTLDGALQLGVAESPNRNGAHFRYENVALLIHNKDIVIGKGSPDPEHDAITGGNHILRLTSLMIGIGKVAPEKIRAVRLETFYQRRWIGGLRPGRRCLKGNRLTLYRAIGWLIFGYGAAGRLIRLGIHGVGVLHARPRGLDTCCRREG